MRLICILAGVYRSFISTTAAYRGHWIGGCDWEPSEEKTPENTHVIQCRRCGHYDVVWSWGSLEAAK